MINNLIHQKSLAHNRLKNSVSSHSFTCLFIGWGEVARQYYYPSLKKLAVYPHLSINITDLKIDAEYPEHFIAWGNADLDSLLLKGQFTHIFILTPPDLHMEQLTYCLERLGKVDHTISLFVEKPSDFDPSRVKYAINFRAAMQNREKIVLRQIDHYVEKGAIRKLKERSAEVLNITGKLHEIIFFSAEKRRIPSSPTFDRGYAIEHGVHAWSILFRLFPKILNIQISLDTNNGPSQAWRYRDATGPCSADTAFLLRFMARSGSGMCDELAPKTKITIAGGKALGMERKELVLKGEYGIIIADLSHDKVVSITGEKKTVRFKDDNTSRSLPYRAILEGILGENPAPFDVTLPLEVGLWSLEKISKGISAVKFLKDYKAGSMPVELKHLVKLLDNL